MEFNDNIKVIPAFKNSPGVKKVGIYARVSTARVEQMRSLAAQVSALAQYVYQRNDMIIREEKQKILMKNIEIVVIATTNQGKIKKIKDIMQVFGIQVISRDEAGVHFSWLLAARQRTVAI